MAKVFLSAGHGGKDPGAVACGLKEKDINLQTMLACKEYLEQNGVTVICSRTTDENDPVNEEVKEANVSGAEIAVSFHANAGGGDGFEAYYYKGDNNGKKLAQLCETQIKTLGQNSRGVKGSTYYGFIRNTKMTAILIESFFVDNDVDNNIGDTVAEQRAIGVAYAKGILEYLNTKTVKKTDEKTQPTQPKQDNTFKPYLVKINCTSLNVRSGVGTSYRVVTTVRKGQVYTIVEERNGWGKLKSGVGWIKLSYTTKI